MGSDVQAPELLAAVEQALVEHRTFGDSAYILGQLEVSFKRRLTRLSADLPAAGTLLEAFERSDDDTRYRICGNTVVRCAVQHAHAQLETGSALGLPRAFTVDVFEETVRHLESGKTGSPFENGPIHLDRLGPERYHGWVWTEEYPDNAFGRTFRYILDQEYGGSLCTPTSDEVAVLLRGEQLLRELLPALAPSALGHAHLVGCFPDVGFWKGKVSSSQIRMGGTIFLSRHILVNPWCVAEHLLHESLHQKLYDFRHGHTLLGADYTSAESPKVISVWNAGDLVNANHWDTHRAFAAFHVYVQLALLAELAEQRADELEERYGPFRGMLESGRALERAHYLGEKLKDVCWDELGTAGRKMRDWLMSVLDYLRPSPPPHGAYIHLMLDLYRREANQVETVLADSRAPGAQFARLLTPIASEEIEGARTVLATISAGREFHDFDAAVTVYTQDELGTHFPAVRRLIAKTILEASPDGYGLTSRAPETNPDDLVRQLVERGSERLYLLQTNVPAPVAGAKRRANDQRFTKSCEDNVGRLLATLAATVPPGGRILEIGTGVGVGLAWITVGLGARTDVEVVSIEGDRRLANAAATWSWPSSVRLVVDDAIVAMPELGTFNLIFADAAPIKYGDVGSVITQLRSGGMLVIDDFHEGVRVNEVQHAEKVALRCALLDHPSLQTVELEWSSGVMLATMTMAPAAASVEKAAAKAAIA